MAGRVSVDQRAVRPRAVPVALDLALVSVLVLIVRYTITVSSLISGLIILWDRPVDLGDVVSIDGVEGRGAPRPALHAGAVWTGARVILSISLITQHASATALAPERPACAPLTLTVNQDMPALRQVLLAAVSADPSPARSPTEAADCGRKRLDREGGVVGLGANVGGGTRPPASLRSSSDGAPADLTG